MEIHLSGYSLCFYFDNTTRLKMVQSELLSSPSTNTNSFITVAIQQYYPISQVEDVINNKLPSITSTQWKTDGLVFTPNVFNYKCGFNSAIKKWKPGHKNTIDFKLKRMEDEGKVWWQISMQQQVIIICNLFSISFESSFNLS